MGHAKHRAHDRDGIGCNQRPEESLRHASIESSLFCIPSKLISNPTLCICRLTLFQRATPHLFHHIGNLGAVEVISKRLTDLAVLLNDRLKSLMKFATRDHSIALKWFGAAHIPPRDRLDGFRYRPTRVPKPVRLRTKEPLNKSNEPVRI